jgi:hypothetical protein
MEVCLLVRVIMESRRSEKIFDVEVIGHWGRSYGGHFKLGSDVIKDLFMHGLEQLAQALVHVHKVWGETLLDCQCMRFLGN